MTSQNLNMALLMPTSRSTSAFKAKDGPSGLKSKPKFPPTIGIKMWHVVFFNWRGRAIQLWTNSLEEGISLARNQYQKDDFRKPFIYYGEDRSEDSLESLLFLA